MEGRARNIFYIAEFLWFSLVITSVLFPLFFIVSFVPVIILTSLFFIKNVRFNLFILVIALTAASAAGGGDFVTVLFSVLIISGCIGVIWGLNHRSYKIGAGLCALVMLASGLMPLVFYPVGYRKKPTDFASDYAAAEADKVGTVLGAGSQLRAAARIYYRFFYDGDGVQKLDKSHAGYQAEANRKFADSVGEWGAEDIFFDFMGLFSVAAIFSFLAVFLINRRTKRHKVGSPSGFAVKTCAARLCDMRLNRRFCLYVFFPAFAFSFLGYIKPLSTVTAAVFNAAVTVPCAFAAFTLLLHTLNRIPAGKLKGALFAVWVLGAATCAAFPLALFYVSFLGLADAVLDVRVLLSYALDKSDADIASHKLAEIKRRAAAENDDGADDRYTVTVIDRAPDNADNTADDADGNDGIAPPAPDGGKNDNANNNNKDNKKEDDK
ncbi:MAG: hypothetical protein LBP26_06660 [Clostridiales bacterium]|jgi:hypothetical protein|nr:hypothetical protein [Clostridiales bacterium]